MIAFYVLNEYKSDSDLSCKNNLRASTVGLLLGTGTVLRQLKLDLVLLKLFHHCEF